MKFIFTFLVLVLTSYHSNAQSAGKHIGKDLKKIEGQWKGSLTYLDYTSGKPYAMDADLAVSALTEPYHFAFANIYPGEPNANSTDTIVVTADGNYIGSQLVRSRKELPDGSIEIITEESGKDGNDNKPANFRHTYTLGKSTFSMKKEVRFVGEEEWIKRHEYVYRRAVGQKEK